MTFLRRTCLVLRWKWLDIFIEQFEEGEDDGWGENIFFSGNTFNLQCFNSTYNMQNMYVPCKVEAHSDFDEDTHKFQFSFIICLTYMISYKHFWIIPDMHLHIYRHSITCFPLKITHFSSTYSSRKTTYQWAQTIKLNYHKLWKKLWGRWQTRFRSWIY